MDTLTKRMQSKKMVKHRLNDMNKVRSKLNEEDKQEVLKFLKQSDGKYHNLTRE